MKATQARLSLSEQIRAARASDPKFNRAHRMVQFFMAAWALIVIADRLIGIASRAYDQGQLPFALAGGAVLIGIAFLGTQGHIQAAMMIMELNMAVFLIQFSATCFFYRDHTVLWSILFYGLSAGILLVNSLMLFLNRDLEQYRDTLRQFRGKKERGPLFYRTNSRLIRNRK